MTCVSLSLCPVTVSRERAEWFYHPEAEKRAPAADGRAEGPGRGAERHGCLPSEAIPSLGARPAEDAHCGAEVQTFGW